MPQHCQPPRAARGGGHGVAVPSPHLPRAAQGPCMVPEVDPAKPDCPECCASPSLCLLYEEPELGNRNRQNTESFYSTPDQKKTQIPFIRCAHTKQTNWRHEDVFCYYSSFIYSSNNFNIPQIIETKKENRELTIRKKMERKISRCKLFTKEILLSSPLYKYDFKKSFVPEPKTLYWLGFLSSFILVQVFPSLLHTGKQYGLYFTEMRNQIFIDTPVIKL